VFPAVADVGVGREVENEVGALHRRREVRQVEVVAAYESEVRMALRAFEETRLAGGEVVPAGDPHAVREQAVDEVGTDEAGGAGDEGVLHRTKSE